MFFGDVRRESLQVFVLELRDGTAVPAAQVAVCSFRFRVLAEGETSAAQAVENAEILKLLCDAVDGDGVHRGSAFCQMVLDIVRGSGSLHLMQRIEDQAPLHGGAQAASFQNRRMLAG